MDDTDDLSKETSTGRIADFIARRICSEGAEMIGGITRHQLLLDEGIDYTSHNSSMCMELETVLPLERIQRIAREELLARKAETSNPGICFCEKELVEDADLLIAFGKRAQNEVLTKGQALQAAEEAGGIILEEHGGSGAGIIGALAGCGLRLSGNDGTLRGKKGEELTGQTLTVKEWKQRLGIRQVVDLDGLRVLDEDEKVSNPGKLKLAYLDHSLSLIARRKQGQYVACRKKDLYENGRPVIRWEKPCDAYQVDNDLGECYSEGEKACWNCLYRRWTADGYQCMK